MTEWTWWCRHCQQELDRGVDAIVCEDVAECIRVGEWGGDACGYIVCKHCRNPAAEIGKNVVERQRRTKL